MKFKKLLFAALSVFAFVACNETPEAPYNPGGNGGTTESAYIDESFASSFGVFSTEETVGDYPWVIDYKTAKATSYVDTDGDGKGDTNMEATSWLISAPIDFTNEAEAYVTFEYIIQYAESGKIAENHQLLISDNYSGDVATATWTDLPYNAVGGRTTNGKVDWNTFDKASVNVPAEFLGKANITFALRYTATTKAGTWEVKNFKVAHGKAEVVEPEEPETPEIPANAYINEAFTNGFGLFTTLETIGDFAWESDAQYGAKASGFANGASQDAESWLISSAIDFSKETAAYIAFDYVINKGDASAAAANHKLLITNNYTGDVATTEWTEVNYGAVNNGNWEFHNTGNIALPESMMGQAAVVIAFKYMSTTANSSTWEIKNVVVASGIGTTPETPETPVEPETPALASFDFTNPEALTPSVERATVEAGATQGAGIDVDGYTFTNGNVSITLTKGSASNPAKFWTRTGGDVELRTYKNSTITISVSEGTMSGIVFKGSQISAMTADSGEFGNGVWSGDAQSVTFSATDKVYITSLEVY